MVTHELEDEYRWELPPTVLERWREALADEPSETSPPVVPYKPAA